jgi:MYXO-CTERM domain-containing protein
VGNTFAIPQALYTITVVPEPGTWAAGGLVLVALFWHQRRRLARFSRAVLNAPIA